MSYFCFFIESVHCAICSCVVICAAVHSFTPVCDVCLQGLVHVITKWFTLWFRGDSFLVVDWSQHHFTVLFAICEIFYNLVIGQQCSLPMCSAVAISFYYWFIWTKKDTRIVEIMFISFLIFSQLNRVINLKWRLTRFSTNLSFTLALICNFYTSHFVLRIFSLLRKKVNWSNFQQFQPLFNFFCFLNWFLRIDIVK